MEATKNTTAITVEATVKAGIEKVWNAWTKPEHITKWCQASNDWHAPAATNDVRTGGKFSTTMAAKDGSVSFDFAGEYSNVIPHQLMEYVLGDGRTVKIKFSNQGDETHITETFDAENIHSLEMQQAGWQAILDNFKKYTEELS